MGKEGWSRNWYIIFYRGPVCPWLCLKWRSYPDTWHPGPDSLGPREMRSLILDIPHSSRRILPGLETLDTRELPINNFGIKTNIWIWRVSGLQTVTVIPRNLGSVSGAIREITGLWVWDRLLCPGEEVTIDGNLRGPGVTRYTRLRILNKRKVVSFKLLCFSTM